MKRVFFAILLCTGLLSAGETVVGIHGFLTTAKSMYPIRDSLRCVGYDVCLWGYPSRDATIRCHACHLIGTLTALACEKPGQPIHFVTHSIGAWVLRAALNLPNCPEEAKMGKAVLVAPPNQGSCLGRSYFNVWPIRLIMGDQSGKELMTYYACDVQRLGAFPECMSIFVIAGTQGSHLGANDPNDGYLTVDETRLETPYYMCILPYSHGKLLSAKESVNMIRNFLCYCQPETVQGCGVIEPCRYDSPTE